jgi:hypothetical protein
VLHIYRQAPGGSIKLITVPHTNGDNRGADRARFHSRQNGNL